MVKKYLCIAVIGWLTYYHSAYAEPRYKLDTLGFYGPEHTRNNGIKNSGAVELNEAGQVIGFSRRYNGGRRDLGRSAWLYDGSRTVNIGLTGTEHTSNEGINDSSVESLNDSGQVIGNSTRFNGGSEGRGLSAWLYDGSRTTKIGLTGAEHSRNNGYKFNRVLELNEAGQVMGLTARFSGGSRNLGQSAWLYDGGRSVNIGLTGVEHTGDDGSKTSRGWQLNESGQVIGVSFRNNGGSTNLGESAWLYNGSRTVNIGLTGPEHTRDDGYRISGARQLNESGQAIGGSGRYNGSTRLGSSAWLYDGSRTVNIGLTGAEHTSREGFNDSSVHKLNETGQAIGSSSRYNGASTYLGTTAWLYDGKGTVNIGLTEAEHTRDDGFRSNSTQQLNEAGQVIGSSGRYNGGSTNLGKSAWLYDGSRTVNIGLTGAEHTRNDGLKSTNSTQLNEAGQVIGSSDRYNGGSEELGISNWFYNGNSTVNIGLTGAEHTRNDGYQQSFTSELNETGQVIGTSFRYDDGSTEMGRTAWFYDPLTDMTYYNDFSVRSSDGYAYSEAQYLGDDGLTLGYYELFDPDSSLLGYRAFRFTVEAGFSDLGLLIDGGLDLFDWEYLAVANDANDMGQILGRGALNNMIGNAVFLATPSAVPLSPAVWLFGSGLLGLIGVARRKA